jgi:hypothetical protein
MCEGFFKFLNRIKRILGIGKHSANETPEKKADKPSK